MNSWVDLPVVSVMEYFGGVMATAYKWASIYGYGFGLIGLIWSGFKVMMSRMTVKELWWDTLFKWVGFILLITLYPSMSLAFNALGTEIGLKAGSGKSTIIASLKELRSAIEKDINTQKAWANDTVTEVESVFSGFAVKTKFENCNNYNEFLDKIQDEISSTNTGWFNLSGLADKQAATKYIQDLRNAHSFDMMYSASTLKTLDAILVEKNLDGSAGDYMKDTYFDLDIFLRDKNGNETKFISPAALLRLAIFCCEFMHQKQQIVYNKVGKEISEKDLSFGDRMATSIEFQLSKIPQTIMLLFCCIVLLLATIFAELQYVMTIVEYIMITGIAAIFIPLMLFDGTKDIPKKFIPVFISFFIKITVITLCIMFVYWLIIEHCVNTISDDGGMNWAAAGQIVFESVLAYLLTQNAPKVAQTIMTGQPQLSMGEALQAAGTTVATGVGMKQAPGAAFKAAARAGNKGMNALGTVQKHHAASKAAVEALGETATAKQKFKAKAKAHGAVASQDLKDRMRAKWEKAGQSSGTGFSIADKFLQQTGLSSGGGSGGGYGGGAGGSSAYGQTGQYKKGREIKSMNNTSNADFKAATRYDDRTYQQRHMTGKEFMDEKAQQGRNIVAQMLEKENAKKAENSGGGSGSSLPDSFGGERAGS